MALSLFTNFCKQLRQGAIKERDSKDLKSEIMFCLTLFTVGFQKISPLLYQVMCNVGTSNSATSKSSNKSQDMQEHLPHISQFFFKAVLECVDYEVKKIGIFDFTAAEKFTAELVRFCQGLKSSQELLHCYEFLPALTSLILKTV